MNKQKPLATSRNILVLAALVATLGIVVVGISLFDRSFSTLRVENAPTGTVNTNVAGVNGVKTAPTFSYQGVKGQSALELLKQNYAVETQEYGFGEMITSINGVSAGEGEFWAFYVDGKMAQVGAGEYVATGNEKFEWRLEEMN